MDDNAAFQDSIPEAYDRYLGPLLFHPCAADMAIRAAEFVPHDGKILELACGTGILTGHLAARLPRATITATDLNDGMLDIARRRPGRSDRIEWKQADASSLPFADESFDAVLCQFGMMFFPEKPRALREALRVLRPGAVLLFSTWDSFKANRFAELTHDTLAGFFPENPPTFYEVPFGMSDTGDLAELCIGAGFGSVSVQTVHLQGESPSAMDGATGLITGNPVSVAIKERGTVSHETIIESLATKLSRAYGERPMRLPLQAHVVLARRPARTGEA